MKHKSLLAISVCFSVLAFSQSKKETTVSTTTTSIEVQDDVPFNIKKQQQSVTQGTVTIGGKNMSYHSVAGMLILKNDADTPTASMSYVAYFKDGDDAS